MSVRDWLLERLHINTGITGAEYGETTPTVPFDDDATDRRSRDKTINRMDSTDPLVNAALSAIAEDAAFFSDPKMPPGFIVNAESVSVQNAIDDFVDRVGIRYHTFDVMRSLVKYGNVFIEVIYNKNEDRIARLKQFPDPYWIKRNEDKFGNLLKGDAAKARRSKQSGIAAFDEMEDGQKYITSFNANQICHIRHDAIEGRTYAYPRLGSAIPAWKTYRAVRDSLAIKCSMSGAYTRIHKIPMPWGMSKEDQKKEIKEYRKNYGTRASVDISDDGKVSIDRVPKIPLDVYVPTKYRTGGEPIGPEVDMLKYPEYNDDFEQIDMWINMILTCLRIPPAYLYWRLYQGGSERSTNVEKIDQQYARTLRRLQMDYIRSIRDIIDMHLLLSGMVGQYEIIVPNVYPQGDRDSAKLTQVQAQAISMGIDAGIDPQWWVSKVLGIPKEDVPYVGRSDNNNQDRPNTNSPGRPRAEED